MNNPTQKDRFLELLEANQDILHKICHVYGEQEEDRRDLGQEMVYQLWKSYPSFQGKSKFTTWMYRLCLNTALVYARQKRRACMTARLKDCHQQIAAPGPESEIEEDVKRLYQAIQGLRRFDRALILLYLERMAYREIADITGISQGNVSVRLVRIRRKLKELMQEEARNGR